MANISGEPNPPFRMIDPNGAPIINNTRHANDKEILRCHSILCKRISLALVSLSVTTFNKVDFGIPTLEAAFRLTSIRAESGKTSSNVFMLSGNEVDAVVQLESR